MSTVRSTACGWSLAFFIVMCTGCGNNSAPTAPSSPMETPVLSSPNGIPSASNVTTTSGTPQLSLSRVSADQTPAIVALPITQTDSIGDPDGIDFDSEAVRSTISGSLATNTPETPLESSPDSLSGSSGSPVQRPDSTGTTADRSSQASANQFALDPTVDFNGITIATVGVEPDNIGSSSLATGPDSSTLKVNPPTPLSPINGIETDDLTPLLTVSSPAPQFITQEQLSARSDLYVFFELSVVSIDGTTTPVETNQTLQTTGPVSYQTNVMLEETTTYQWRARAKIGDELGPWSATATFATPALIGVPTPLSPTSGTTVPNRTPELVVTNPEILGLSDVIIEFRLDDDGATFPSPVTFEEPLGAGGTTADTFEDSLAPSTQFWWAARGKSAAAGTTSEWSETYTFTSSAENRTADPLPGQKLPLPNQLALITQLARANPGLLTNSCQEEGGTWEFMDLAVEKLRETDTRWGFNCKRGDCNHISIDVVDYFYGIGDGNLSTDVYIIDIIQNHCSHGSENPAWYDLTQATKDGGEIGRWKYPRQ